MIRKYAEIFCWKNVSSFCSAKATHIYSAKNIRILYIESAKTVNEMTLNELVKLTTLWTTGPSLEKYTLLLSAQFISICKELTLKVLSTTIADSTLIFFLYILGKLRLAISCELHKMSILFSLKNNRTNFRMSSAPNLHSILRVNP